MSQKGQINMIPGVTREEETKTLAEIIEIAENNLKQKRDSVQNIARELHELQEVYDVSDKEGLAQWFNTDARFKLVRQELLSVERSRKKPYFGRIDFTDDTIKKQECYYIGKSVIAKDKSKPRVIDWRAPIASVYYEKSLGKCTYSVKGEGAYEIELSRKRTYEIENDELVDFYDTDVVANDELLTKYLARNKKKVLGEIIATIQQEQNEIIRKKPQHNMIVQGGAGSGKTTVAMHRISYILYNYDLEFQPKDFYIIGSNKILLNYITGILPDLDVYGASQMTMEQLFIRLLYEDWDDNKYTTRSLNKNNSLEAVKGSFSWFHDLEKFCEKYEWNYIPRKDVYIEKNHHLLMKQEAIEKLLKEFAYLSLPDKLNKLTEHLMAQLENEVYGKHYSYSNEEKKKLIRYYQTYFGRREWKGSIFKLYNDFLAGQNIKGHNIALKENEFDLYDLAALAYLYKRIKETEVIQEASHVVIDEAQDFGMMVYGSLKYCLSKCTYTIMGDVSQNIYFDYGLTDWEELRSLMLPGEFDYFGLLRKSYRNTVEISNFALNILRHGSFPIYPVEPIIRHGSEVTIAECQSKDSLILKTADIIKIWQTKGYETIAVICRDDMEAGYVTEKLGAIIHIKDFNAQNEEFGNGIMVLPIEYSKGLEFDAVLLFNADAKNYPMEDGVTKLLYVAATRALHELTVLYIGQLTDLIAVPVTENTKQQVILGQVKTKRKQMPQEEPKTRKETELQRALEGTKEMELRDKFGPKRIVIKASPQSSFDKTHVKGTIGRKIDYYSGTSYQNPVKKSENITKDSHEMHSEFGEAPGNISLKPLGHPKINFAVLWVNTSKDYVELTSSYGVLRITPISAGTVRISFGRKQIENLSPVIEELVSQKPFKWNCKETRDKVEVCLEKLTLRIDKKTGVLSFFTSKEFLLLSERIQTPRQMADVPKKQAWAFFDWTQKEVIKARKDDLQWMELPNTARYISHGKDSNTPALLMSNKGYQLIIPSGKKVLCCTIPMYGPYIHLEGEMQIDYFFRTVV